MKKIPSSVYHLQFGENFKLIEAIKLLPYLAKLGIEGVYCSPYFAAESLHGYDTIDTVPDYNAPESEKFKLHRKLLNFRKKHKKLFLEGTYTENDSKAFR